MYSIFATADTSYDTFHIGATDVETEGTFRWITTNSALTYTNWRHGEPSRNVIHEDCVGMFSDNGKWNDYACDHWQLPAVCELERTTEL